MKDKLRAYILKLQAENDARSEELNTEISQYRHTVLVHQYNLTLEILKELKDILLTN